jgi:hypothetical protein
MKQTAVDWMFDQLWETPKDKLAWFKILMEAKEMERKQIKDSYSAGVWEIGCFNRNPDAKEYYKETYVKDA